MFHKKPHKRGQMKQVSETFVPVVNSVLRLNRLPLPEGATRLFEHYIVNENGKQIRFRDIKAKEHGIMCVMLFKSIVLQNNQRLCASVFLDQKILVLPVYSHSCHFSAVHFSVEIKLHAGFFLAMFIVLVPVIFQKVNYKL